jgi:hypothetical protein
MTDRNVQRAEILTTGAIRNILDAVPDTQPSVDWPLVGQVYVKGIGWITVKALRAELERRDQ